ncbi:hypothetical protein [Niabella ginsengisoli]|uniref:Uncharacterized protein n=1 Tax=Niabella ginsengisoli TaxID=522298 RepID=A0ABS9SKP9_9BACT|nr:hypothetical protein [Niabella ginsengisoli]MCH5598951.1 hypothetical protein [Niabella ginsengisoli]
MARIAKENLAQVEIINAIIGSGSKKKALINDGWESLLLAAEHTWGYQNPKDPFAKVIEKNKQQYFSGAKQLSDSLLASFSDTTVTQETYSVVNTLSWNRKGIVTLRPEQSQRGDKVINISSGKEMLSQRLSNGDLIFRTEIIPALSSRMYKVAKGKYKETKDQISSQDNILSNDLLRLEIDPVTGNIQSVIKLDNKHEYISPKEGVNSYYYLKGVFNGKDQPGNPQGVRSVTIQKKNPALY